MVNKFLNLIKWPVLAGSMVVAVTGNGHAATAVEQSCALISALQSGRENGIAKMREIMHLVSDEDFAPIALSMERLHEIYDEGELVEVFRVGDLVVEHFIVLNANGADNLYMRLIYQKTDLGASAVKLFYTEKAIDALSEWQFAQDPIPVRCLN